MSAQVHAEVQAAQADTASKRMRALIQAMSIETIISIDDSHSLGSVDGVSAEVTEELISSPELLEVVLGILHHVDDAFGFTEVDHESESAVNDFLTENWIDFENKTKTELFTAARTRRKDREGHLAEGDTDADLAAPQRLQEIIGDAAVFIRVSLAQWKQDWQALLEGPGQILVLIDRSFINEDGGTETTGEGLLNDLLEQKLSHVRAGLLTLTASDEGAEIQLTNALRARFSAQADRVVAIGKFRLKNIEEFPSAVRMLLLVVEVAAYRKLATDAAELAHTNVKLHLDELHDYTFIGAIAAAQDEGTFELDHPLRMAQRVYQQQLLKAMRDADFGANILPRFREGAVGTFVNASAAGKQIREVLRADIFEPDGHVNELGLPIEIGDVFRVESLYPQTSKRQKTAPAYYILLAQACDLSMRSDGKRSNDLDELILQRLEIVDEDELRTNVKKSGRMHLLGELEAASDQKWAVNFARTIIVPTSAVDATVFRDDGASILNPKAVEARPMAAGWLSRQRALSKLAAGILGEYGKAEEAMKKVSGKEELLLRIGASLAGATMQQTRGVTAVIDPSQGTLRYGIQRYGRVRSDIAVNVASLSATYSSRPAFEAKGAAEPEARADRQSPPTQGPM
ncbi:hypothetical protein ADILRU_2286 [Leifsonia rubra CMS 76R]|nr:hypothetical protein ADILRU_2286 [Leifsonia rubra CMS 76R]